jgi:hypothetical protein
VKLYRYRRIDEWLIQYLQDQRLYFSSPLAFNDPFDFDLECIIAGSPQALLASYRGYLAVVQSDALSKIRMLEARTIDYQSDPPPYRRHYDEAFVLYRRQFDFVTRELEAISQRSDEEQAERLLVGSWNEKKRLLAQGYGVLCFSESNSNMLLWSHYADGHRGVSLEYDSAERPVKRWKNWQFLRVGYTVDRRIDISRVGFHEAFIHLLSTKGVDWAYEREHRLVTLLGPGYQEGRMQALTGIIFGARISENPLDMRLALYKALKDLAERRRSIRAISFYRAEKKPSQYEVRLRPLSGFREVGKVLAVSFS